ncbi:alpha/beta fold hydrolase [Paraburkholderia xenovorans]
MSCEAATEIKAPEWFDHAITIPRASRFVNVDDARIHCAAWNGGESNKPPLLFVHGFIAHARWWDFIAPHFMARYRVYAMDFSGMGDSDRSESYEVDRWIGEIAAVAKEVGGGQKVTLVGHSFGGARSFEATYRFPDLFEKTITIDSYYHFDDRGPRKKRYIASSGEERTYESIDEGVGRFRFSPDQETLPYIFQYIARNSLREKVGGWGWKFDNRVLDADRPYLDCEQMLSGLKVPMAFIRAQHSVISTPDMMARVHKGVPGSRLITIDDAGHHIMTDKPLELVAALNSLL